MIYLGKSVHCTTRGVDCQMSTPRWVRDPRKRRRTSVADCHVGRENYGVADSDSGVVPVNGTCVMGIRKAVLIFGSTSYRASIISRAAIVAFFPPAIGFEAKAQ